MEVTCFHIATCFLHRQWFLNHCSWFVVSPVKLISQSLILTTVIVCQTLYFHYFIQTCPSSTKKQTYYPYFANILCWNSKMCYCDSKTFPQIIQLNGKWQLTFEPSLPEYTDGPVTVLSTSFIIIKMNPFQSQVKLNRQYITFLH